jgi:malate/lactate dehydrogenase
MKVGIVGSGFVGATAGYALVMQGVGREIVLVDKNAARAVAEADDIRHAVPFAHPLYIRAGDYQILQDQRAVLTVATPTADVCGVRNVTVSLPRLVGGQGVLETFPQPLRDAETAALRASARVIRQALDELGDNL